MFNVGSEDKEKLRENMEEIKNLIQGKKDRENKPKTATPPSAQEEETLSSGIEEEGLENSRPLGSEAGSTDSLDQEVSDSSELGKSSQNDSTDQISEGGFGSDLNSQSTLDASDEPQELSKSNNVRETVENNSQRMNSGSNFSSPNSPANNQGQVVNETATQTQEPQTQSRTGSQKLFLEVERFEKVKDMIEEMQQLTEDIETTSNDLEEQINDERESENVAQQLLNNFDDRKREVEDVILDSEEN